MSIVTFEQLNDFFEDTSEDIIERFVEPLNEVLAFYEINTPERISMFLAQVGHESGGLRTIKENINYSAEGLKRVFPKYFRTVNPADYAKKPEKIANRVYASRMGNGDEASGDGFRFRGRGAIQLTGRSNYTTCGADLEVDLINNPDWLEEPEGAIRSAAWFWDSRDLNQWADAGDIVTVTKKINGGTIGLEDRQSHYAAALEIFTA